MMQTEIYLAYIGVPERIDPRLTQPFWRDTARSFQGYTITIGKGGWINDSGVLVEDSVITAQIVTSQPYARIKEWAEKAATVYSQQYIMVVRLGTRGSELVKHPSFQESENAT